MALYAKGTFTTRKVSITVDYLGTWPVVMGKMITPSMDIASLKNPIKGKLAFHRWSL